MPSADQVQAAVPPLQTQVHRDFAPAWGVSMPGLTFVPAGSQRRAMGRAQRQSSVVRFR